MSFITTIAFSIKHLSSFHLYSNSFSVHMNSVHGCEIYIIYKCTNLESYYKPLSDICCYLACFNSCTFLQPVCVLEISSRSVKKIVQGTRYHMYIVQDARCHMAWMVSIFFSNYCLPKIGNLISRLFEAEFRELMLVEIISILLVNSFKATSHPLMV